MASVVLACSGCSDDGPGASESALFTLDHEQAQALEVVQVTIDASMPAVDVASYEVLVGDRVAPSLNLFDHTLMFVVPSVDPGSTSVRLRGGGGDSRRSFVVLASDPISEPRAVITAALDATTARMVMARADLEGLPAGADVAAMMADLDASDAALAAARAELESADPAALEAVARFLLVNAELLDSTMLGETSARSVTSPALTPKCTNGEFDDIPRCLNVELATRMTKLIVLTSIGGAAGAIIGELVNPAAIALGGRIGAVIGAGVGIVQIQEWLWVEFARPARRVAAYYGFGTSSLVGPSLRIGQPVSVELQTGIRALAESDATPEYTVLAGIVTWLHRFRSLIDVLVAAGADVHVSPFSLSGVANVPEAVVSAASPYLRVEPATQTLNGITFTASLSGGTLTLAATGQAGVTQSFTFDLVYENPGIASYNESVSITVLGSCGDGIAQAGEEWLSTRFSGWILASGGRGRGECLSSRA